MNSFSGFETLIDVVSNYIQKAEDPLKILEAGAKEFVYDLGKLTKPMSEIQKSGYTHLIDTFGYETRSGEVVVGWGKYYGRMVEHGTSKMVAREHFRPVFNQKKEKYYKKMLDAMSMKTWN